MAMRVSLTVALAFATVYISPVAATASTASNTPYLTALFILDSQPRQLYASPISYGTFTDDQPFQTLLVNCPTTASPDTNHCNQLSQYPAQLWHASGSIFGGTLGLSNAARTSTIWTCHLGSDTGDSILSQDGRCTQTVFSPGGSVVRETGVNSCYVTAHSALIQVTTEAEALSAVRVPFTNAPAVLSSIFLSATASCAVPVTVSTAGVSGVTVTMTTTMTMGASRTSSSGRVVAASTNAAVRLGGSLTRGLSAIWIIGVGLGGIYPTFLS